MNSPAPLDQLVLEIRFYSQQTALNMIEVGKRLIDAKKQVPHGEWGKWLKHNFKFSSMTASRFVNMAVEAGNLTSMLNLDSTKILAILDLPTEQREPFIQEHPVEQMSTRQVQAAVKAQKEAEKRTAETEEENRLLRQENRKLATQKMQTQIVEKPIIPDDYKDLQSENKRLANSFKEVLLQKERLAKDLDIERQAAKMTTKATQDVYDHQKEFEARANMISGRIALFIRDMAAFGYMGADYFRCSEYSREKYEKAIERLEKLTRDLREQMHVLAIKGDTKIINAEVVENE